MNRYQLLILFVITLLPFAAYQLRPDIIGYDGYHFLNLACGKEAPITSDIVENIVMPMLPCNIIAVKMLLFALCFCSTLIIAKIGELYDPENGWIAGVLVWLAAAWFFEFAKFENDQLAYPLIMLSIYLFLLSFRQRKLLLQLAALIVISVSAVIWGGAVFSLIAFAFVPGAQIFALPAGLVLLMFTHPFVTAASGYGVMENLPLIGLPFLGLLLLGVFGWRKKELLIPGGLLLLLGVLNPKFAILAIPFLVAGLVLLIKKIPQLRAGLLIASVIMLLVVSTGVLVQPPTLNEHAAIEYAIEIAGDEKISNDWHLGFLVKWHGGATDNYAFYRKQEFTGITITYDEPNCKIIKDFGGSNVYRC